MCYNAIFFFFLPPLLCLEHQARFYYDLKSFKSVLSLNRERNFNKGRCYNTTTTATITDIN